MSISAGELKSRFKTIPQLTSQMLGKILREFGYPSVTDNWVEGEMERLINGGEPRGGPSIFLAGWLKDGID